MRLMARPAGGTFLATLLCAAAAGDIQTGFGGQYRINACSVDSDAAASDDQRASRLCLRQNVAGVVRSKHALCTRLQAEF